jgi:VWFA-related protein
MCGCAGESARDENSRRIGIMRRVLVGALFVLTATHVIGSRQEPQAPTFRAGAPTVSVYATVIDATGRLVPDLTRDDFDVFDNGTRQDLSLFTNNLQPITIVIMLDRSGSMQAEFTLVRDAAEHFVAQLMPADRARLGSFSNRVQIDPLTFTSDRQELLRILHDNLQEGGLTPLWNATNAAMAALAHEEGRRVVLMFTDGHDNPKPDDVKTSLEEVQARAQADGTMVYAIGLATGCSPAPASHAFAPMRILFQRRGGGGGPGGAPPGIPGGIRIPGLPGGRGLPGSPGAPTIPGSDRPSTDNGPCRTSEPDPGLKTLADASGGGYFELRDTDNLGATFARVADELHRQYLLAFTATTLDGQIHTLEVRVHRPNTTVRTRQSYVAAPMR